MTACVTPCQFGQSPDRRRPRGLTAFPKLEPAFSDSQPRAEVLPQGAEERHGRAHPPPRPKRKSAQPYPQKAAVGGGRDGKQAKKGSGAGVGKGTGVSLAPPEGGGGPPMGVRHASPGVMGAPPPVNLVGPGGVLGGGYR